MASELIPEGGDYVNDILQTIENSDIFCDCFKIFTRICMGSRRVGFGYKNIIPFYTDDFEWHDVFKFRVPNVQVVDVSASAEYLD